MATLSLYQIISGYGLVYKSDYRNELNYESIWLVSQLCTNFERRLFKTMDVYKRFLL